MPELLNYLLSGVQPDALRTVLEHWQQLVFSSDMLISVFAIAVLRFQVPAFILWIANAVRPAAFHTPPADRSYRPLVSVIIAGRNPGAGIRKCLRSVLDSSYPNLEALYADDYSTDDSVACASDFERTGRVRVFASAQHYGKPSNLNIAIRMARGSLVFILDADAEVEFGTIAKLVPYFQDPRVGGVTADIRVRNAGATLLTRLQEVEYALNGSIARLWRASIGLLPILPGAASMIRMDALRALGGYDTGLGDDTDLTLRLRKARWTLRYAVDARIWTDEPAHLVPLLNQRIRWTRNMVKIRLRKHGDMALFRYGWQNTLVFLDSLLFRVLLPIYAVTAILYSMLTDFGDRAILLTTVYIITVFAVSCKVLIANDIAATPPLADFIFVPLYPPYRFLMRTVEAFTIVREFLRIRLYHPYVPKRIWAEIPHW